MAFEQLNYSTEGTDDESLQDMIDKTPTLNASRTDIALLEKEVFEGIDSVRVDIFEKGSYLKVRDKNGAIISDPAATNPSKHKEVLDNQVLKVINTDGNDHIVGGPKQKLFVHVMLPDGTTGYVSADYVKVSVPEVVTEDDSDTDPSDWDDDGGKLGDVADVADETVVEEIVPEVNASEESEGAPAIIEGFADDVAEPEVVEENYLQPTSVIRDGAIFFINKDGEGTITELPLMQSVEDAYPGLSEYVSIWKLKAEKKVEGMVFTGLRSYDEEIEASTARILDLLQLLSETINYPIRDSRRETTLVERIFEEMAKYDKAKHTATGTNVGVRGNHVLENSHKVADLFLKLSPLTQEQKLIQMYDMSRRRLGNNGDSELVKEFVGNKILQKPDYASILEMLQSDTVIDMIRNEDKANLSTLISSSTSGVFNSEEITGMVDSMVKSFREIRTKLERPEYEDQLAVINRSGNERLLFAGKPRKSIVETREERIDIALEKYVKNDLLYNIIAKKDDRGSENTLEGMYADMSGLAGSKSSIGDFFDIADENIDAAIKYSLMAGTSLLPMGIGLAAAGGAVKLAGWAGARAGTHLASTKTGTTLAGYTKTGAALTGASKLAVAGTAFHEVSLPIQNAMKMDASTAEEFFNGSVFVSENKNWRELTKSIAFFGALKIMSPGVITSGAKKLTSRIPDSVMSSSFVTSAGSLATKGANALPGAVKTVGTATNKAIFIPATQAAALTGVSQGIEISFDLTTGSDDYKSFTWEEYLQALMMIGATKAGGRFVAGRNKKGDIQVAKARDNVESKSVNPGLPKEGGPGKATPRDNVGNVVISPRNKKIEDKSPKRIEDMRGTTTTTRGRNTEARDGLPAPVRPLAVEKLIPKTGLQSKFTHPSTGKEYIVKVDGKNNVSVYNKDGIKMQGATKSALLKNGGNEQVNRMNTNPRDFQNNIIPTKPTT